MSKVPLPESRIRLRYAGVCATCARRIEIGEPGIYNRDLRTVVCIGCFDPTAHAPQPMRTGLSVAGEATPGIAGASARREYARRVGAREQRIRAAHPRLGGLILALTEEPQSTRAWLRGACGEEQLGNGLDRLANRGVRLLHDRRIPGGRANIDHLAISRAGVFVIDAKRYRGRPQLRVQGGLLRPRTESLIVGGRDRTQLVIGVIRQIDRVSKALDAIGLGATVPVRGMLCFVDADWPLIGGAFQIHGVDVVYPRKAVERICGTPRIEAQVVGAVYGALASQFPSA